jgi:hypothetical protein
MASMPRRYFDFAPDMTVRGRWTLGLITDPQGQEVDDPWIFKQGRPIPHPGRLKIPIQIPGKALDLSYAGMGALVVHIRVASVLAELAPEDVQVFPVEVEGQPDQFCVLVATKLVRCIDERASRYVEIWQPEDGRPEKVGLYRDVRGLRIDPSKVDDSKVFRTWGWSIVLIVREDIKDALERSGATGMQFVEV